MRWLYFNSLDAEGRVDKVRLWEGIARLNASIRRYASLF
jgi:hypothetical protein